MKKINFLLITLLFSGYSQQANASQFQPVSSIQEAVRHYIVSNLSLDTEYKLKLSQFDNRLHLPLCTEPLEVFTHSGSIKPGRNSIGVKCNHAKKWTVYTSAIISIYRDVIVLSQPVRRGDVFSAAILKPEKRDVSTLRSGFITDLQTIVNKQATRNLGLGSVINKSNIREPKLIKRGEKLTIKASNPNIEISAAGVALMDGIKNQNIRVKNLKSQQIIHATVVKPGLVVVIF